MSHRPGGRDRAPAVVATSRVLRAAWITAGCAAVAIGTVAIIVPGLPTTVFFVGAAWCFARSSPRFEAWVLGLPKVGQLVRDHRDGLGMPQRTKVVAIGMMWTAVVASALLVRDRPWLSITILLAGAVGTAVLVWHVPTRERVLAERVLALAGDGRLSEEDLPRATPPTPSPAPPPSGGGR